MRQAFPLIRIAALFLFPALLAYGAYTFMVGALMRPADPNSTETVSVLVQPGMNFRGVCRQLQEQGIVRYARSLDLLARLRDKKTEKIIVGEYLLSASMTPETILNKLVSGDIFKRKVLLREGESYKVLPDRVAQSGLVTLEDINKTLADPQLLARAGISASNFEGYLFPNTYEFSRPVEAHQIVWAMLEEGEKHWPPEFSDQADKLGMTRHEILTLASIIEKETGIVEEQPTISSVFHNRLKAGMKLQADPTVIYGLVDFDGNLRKADLLDAHDYNTYVHFGLPPGPIANPGESAIRAALFPAETEYLFFVADGTGAHVFSTTLGEHNAAVLKYQKKPQETDPVDPVNPVEPS
ncbi:MAG: endolytic transglycosylase MltG [Bdellovibrionales bacterium]|nr:endolytic transglycosylase MltG [Bdellovibrionales bacterium]